MPIDLSKVKMTVPDWVQKVIEEWDAVPKPHFELEISESLKKVKDINELSDSDYKGFYAEWSAFFFQDLSKRKSDWNTHFGPMISFGDQHSPDVRMLDAEIITHWEQRAKSSKSPIMRARYADLVWDFKRTVTNESPSHEFALIAVDAYAEATKRELFKMPIEGVGWLRRALQLSLTLRDENRTKQVIAAIFDFYDAVAQPRLAGIWIAPFDLLHDQQKHLTPEQKQKLVGDLEKMLDITSGGGKPDEFDPFGAQSAAERLAKHYRSKKEPENVRRVFLKYAGAFKSISEKANPLFAMAWLQPVIEELQNENLKAEAEDLQKLFEDKAKNVHSDLKTIQVETKIEQKEIDSWLQGLIVRDNLQQALINTTIYFIPKADAARTLLEKLKRDAPLLSLTNVLVIKKDGTPTAKIGSIDEDEEGRLHQQLNQTIGFYQPFLLMAFDEIKRVYSPQVDQIVEFLALSPLFGDEKDTLLKQGIEAYLQQDYVKAIHVLIPQIERIMRKLLPLVGVPILKTVRDSGVMDAKGMNDILREHRVRNAFGENIWRYLFVVYVDKRGMNLRNDLAHGLLSVAAFNKAVADCVFHTLLVLSLTREAQKPQPAEAKG